MRGLSGVCSGGIGCVPCIIPPPKQPPTSVGDAGMSPAGWHGESGTPNVATRTELDLQGNKHKCRRRFTDL